jgi:HSP20 family molecular chaperone IbpA
MKPKVLHEGDPLSERIRELEDEIERRALCLTASHSVAEGSDLCDWCDAEASLLEPGRVDVKEDAGEFIVTTPAPGFADSEVEVGVDNRHAVIHCHKAKREILRDVTLREKIVPEKATVAMHDGLVEVDLPKEAHGGVI